MQLPRLDTSSQITQGVWMWLRTEYADGSTVESANPNSYTFGPPATTRRACVSDDANAQEHAFLNALAATTTSSSTASA